MSFARSPVLIAIVVSAGLWVLGVLLAPAGGGRGAYSVLVCSGTVPDREIRERLEKEGFSGLVSESGQRVLLDSFTRIEQIPLDEYDSRVLSFDPRNDGYAKKLRSLFVQNDKRFIYIPRSGGPFVPAQLAGVEKRLAAALGDMLYSYYDARSFSTVTGRQAGLSLLLFCLAGFAFFIISPLRRALKPHAACLFPLLPALAPLCLGGAAGFALASLLTGCAVLLAEPCLERLTRTRGLYRQRMPLLAKLLPPFLLIAYGALAVFSGLPLVFTLVTFACVCGIFILSLRNVARADDTVAAAADIASAIFGDLFSRRQQESEHRRFSPVLILKPHVPVFAFSGAMIPFTAAALTLAFIGIFASLSAPVVSPVLPSAAAVTEADYQAHCLFQSAFSERSLHAFESPHDMRTRAYELAPDGLSVIPASVPPNQNPFPGVPPFPLADLLKFLDNPGHGGAVLYEILFALLPLLFILSPLIRRK